MRRLYRFGGARQHGHFDGIVVEHGQGVEDIQGPKDVKGLEGGEEEDAIVNGRWALDVEERCLC